MIWVNELKIIANVTTMGLVIGVIFYLNASFIEQIEILDVIVLDAIVLGLMFGAYIYLSKGAYHER